MNAGSHSTAFRIRSEPLGTTESRATCSLRRGARRRWCSRWAALGRMVALCVGRPERRPLPVAGVGVAPRIQRRFGLASHASAPPPAAESRSRPLDPSPERIATSVLSLLAVMRRGGRRVAGRPGGVGRGHQFGPRANARVASVVQRANRPVIHSRDCVRGPAMSPPCMIARTASTVTVTG